MWFTSICKSFYKSSEIRDRITMKIKGVWAREILDSRGNPTVEADVVLERGFGSAAAPSGASRGKREAVELRDGGRRYMGKGVKKAVENVNSIIGPAITELDAENQEEIDRRMIEIDGTGDKSNLGGNAMVAVSIAVLKAAASAKGISLPKHLGGDSIPRGMFNIINGGKHAGGKLAIQEFMIVPSGENFSERLRRASEIYHVLGNILVKRYDERAKNVGDEGGYAPSIEKTQEALDTLSDAIEEAGYGGNCSIAMDCAASSFYKEETGEYSIDGMMLDKGRLTDFYTELIDSYDIISIEDPFFEEDFDAYTELLSKSMPSTQIVGDDLLVTNPDRIKQAIQYKSVNALLLKVNQIGTVTEALEAVETARDGDFNIIVSHRSGETEDCFIADFSVGINAEFIKSGAPARGERTSKYNQLLRLEEAFAMAGEET